MQHLKKNTRFKSGQQYSLFYLVISMCENDAEKRIFSTLLGGVTTWLLLPFDLGRETLPKISGKLNMEKLNDSGDLQDWVISDRKADVEVLQ